MYCMWYVCVLASFVPVMIFFRYDDDNDDDDNMMKCIKSCLLLYVSG